MTTVSFLVEQARIVGFDVQGHSGWGEEGSDIVCAAVTSAIRLVESTVNDVMGLCAAVKVNERETSITLRTPRSSFVCPAACPLRRRAPVRIC